MAFFDTPDALVDAVRALRKAGYEGVEAYTPFPLEALGEALGIPGNHVSLGAFIGGLIGGVGMLAMQYFSAVLHYPIRVGGRPFASWPAFIPPALEVTFLLAAAGGVLAMLLGNRLPTFYHPVFHIDRFERASQDAFVLVVCSHSAKRDDATLKSLLQALGAVQVDEVPA
ncbi:DUF3341 domain-containing protein [Dyella monticola]|nr:DUF3341 domain-containing protein [Dyella monticola]